MRYRKGSRVHTVVKLVEAIIAGKVMHINGAVMEAKSLRPWSIARLNSAIYLDNAFYATPIKETRP